MSAAYASPKSQKRRGPAPIAVTLATFAATSRRSGPFGLSSSSLRERSSCEIRSRERSQRGSNLPRRRAGTSQHRARRTRTSWTTEPFPRRGCSADEAAPNGASQHVPEPLGRSSSSMAWKRSGVRFPIAPQRTAGQRARHSCPTNHRRPVARAPSRRGLSGPSSTSTAKADVASLNSAGRHRQARRRACRSFSAGVKK